MPQILCYCMIGVAVFIFMALIWEKYRLHLKDTTQATTTADTIFGWTIYLAARKAVEELRLIDATTDVDFSAELDEIERKAAACFKRKNNQEATK